MPDLDDELAELQRRAYGAGGEVLTPEERTRLAQLESQARILGAAFPTNEAPRPILGSRAEAAMPAFPPLHDVPARGSEPAPSGEAPDEPPIPQHTSDRMHGQANESALADRAGAQAVGVVRPRWFPPALIATIAVAAAIVMVVAGFVGWGGGYTAGIARSGNGLIGGRLLAELSPTDPPEELMNSDGPMMYATVPDDRTELVDGLEYFGEMLDDVHVSVSRSAAMLGMTDVPVDAVCLSAAQVVELSEEMLHTAGASACGSERLGVVADVFVVAEDAPIINGVTSDEYPPDTLLRLIYSAKRNVVSVYEVPPDPAD